jgi:hypothetical protein
MQKTSPLKRQGNCTEGPRRPVLLLRHPPGQLLLEDLQPELVEQAPEVRLRVGFRRQIDRPPIAGEILRQHRTVVVEAYRTQQA